METLAEMKKYRIDGMRSEQLRAETSEFTVGGRIYTASNEDQSNFNSVAVMVNPDDSDSMALPCVVDGSLQMVDHTHSMIREVGQALGAHKYAQYAKYKTLVAQIEECATLEQLQAIQW